MRPCACRGIDGISMQSSSLVDLPADKGTEKNQCPYVSKILNDCDVCQYGHLSNVILEFFLALQSRVQRKALEELIVVII